MAVTIEELRIADEPASWAALGFDVVGERCMLGAVALRFLGSAAGRGIAGWSLRGIADTELDGLPTTLGATEQPPPADVHANGVRSIDHVVVMSPELSRTVEALESAGLDLRRIREEPTPAGAPRQAFFRLGAEILEVVQEPEQVIARTGGTERAAQFWGLALVVEDLDATCARMAPHVGDARAAVQSGRRIATVRRSAGLSVPLALMSAAGSAAVAA
jgi:hypothetical protein